ncbi:MAG: hypothetical protein HC817_12515 [Saprospiraceae bacterium]|nr:hypothetical protein [Saprospiraceae bacterium]
MVANLRTMGYPEHFAGMLTFWKVLGVLAIAIPQVPARFKEWAYGCFFVEFLCAAYVLFVTPDFSNQVAFPLVFVAILAGSYYYYHKLKAAN